MDQPAARSAGVVPSFPGLPRTREGFDIPSGFTTGVNRETCPQTARVISRRFRVASLPTRSGFLAGRPGRTAAEVAAFGYAQTCQRAAATRFVFRPCPPLLVIGRPSATARSPAWRLPRIGDRLAISHPSIRRVPVPLCCQDTQERPVSQVLVAPAAVVGWMVSADRDRAGGEIMSESARRRPKVEPPTSRSSGARVHNLRNLDLDIPRNRMVVGGGPSGSGKSSLAFDTLYAEGQRQYIESLSVYARQFLNQIERPTSTAVEGLQPTISIDQRAGNPQSKNYGRHGHGNLRLLAVALRPARRSGVSPMRAADLPANPGTDSRRPAEPGRWDAGDADGALVRGRRASARRCSRRFARPVLFE